MQTWCSAARRRARSPVAATAQTLSSSRRSVEVRTPALATSRLHTATSAERFCDGLAGGGVLVVLAALVVDAELPAAVVSPVVVELEVAVAVGVVRELVWVTVVVVVELAPPPPPQPLISVPAASRAASNGYGLRVILHRGGL